MFDSLDDQMKADLNRESTGTERLLRYAAVAVASAAGADVSEAGAAGAAAVVGAAPFLAAAVPFGCARCCCIFFALSSVTMMSPCCSTAALSSTDFSASDQVWPGALQEQVGLNSVRNLNAFGSAV